MRKACGWNDASTTVFALEVNLASCASRLLKSPSPPDEVLFPRTVIPLRLALGHSPDRCGNRLYFRWTDKEELFWRSKSHRPFDDGGKCATAAAENDAFSPGTDPNIQQLQQELGPAEEEPEGDQQLLQGNTTELQQCMRIHYKLGFSGSRWVWAS